MINSQTKVKQSNQAPDKMLRSILQEIRLLRYEVRLILPTEDLQEYAHPKRIKRSYENALKAYPANL